MDALLDIQRVYPRMAKLLESLAQCFDDPGQNSQHLEQLDRDLQTTLSDCYLNFLELVKTEHEGSELADFLSIHQRLRSKITAFRQHLQEG